MKPSILVSNYNSDEAIQLCVESIRKYTPEGTYDLIVYNDLCTNGIDNKYLRECQDRGWLKFYETKKRLGHGGVVNKLLNEICDADQAVILDCDIQILGPRWLEDGLQFLADDILGICDYRHEAISAQGWCPGFYRAWFLFLNMRAYRDLGKVDWEFSYADAREWPYNQMFGYLNAIPKPSGFDENLACCDPGSKLWIKVRYYNPKEYRMLDVPRSLFIRFRHSGHIAYWYDLPDNFDAYTQINKQAQKAEIHRELERLRCQ